MIIKHTSNVCFFMVFPSIFWGAIFSHIVSPELGQAICILFLASGLLTLMGYLS